MGPANILRWGRDAGTERELKDAKREAKKTQRRAKRKPKEVKGANGWPEDQKNLLKSIQKACIKKLRKLDLQRIRNCTEHP